MSLINSIRSNYRFALGVRRYLREPVDADQARERIERRLSTRREAFLRVLEQAVYCKPDNPLLQSCWSMLALRSQMCVISYTKSAWKALWSASMMPAYT